MLTGVECHEYRYNNHLHSQFLTVQKRCVEFLLHTLNETNALQYFGLGDMIGVPELSKQSLAYLLYHFDSIADSRELFCQLHIELLVKVLGHPNLNCRSEVEILHVINRWIIDQSNIVPEENILELFSCARFKVLSLDDMKTITTLPFVQDSKILSKLVSVLTMKLEGETFKTCSCHCHNKGNSLQFEMEGCQACHQIGQADDETNSDQEGKVDKRNSPCLSSPLDSRLRQLFRSRCCSKKEETLIDSDDNEEAKVCYPPAILDLADDLLSTSPRAPPFIPCVVGHIRRTEIPSG